MGGGGEWEEKMGEDERGRTKKRWSTQDDTEDIMFPLENQQSDELLSGLKYKGNIISTFV